MVNSKLITWAEKQKFNGFTAKQVEGFLIKKGYTQNDATDIVTYVYGEKKPEPQTKLYIGISIGIILLVLIAILLFWYFS